LTYTKSRSKNHVLVGLAQPPASGLRQTGMVCRKAGEDRGGGGGTKLRVSGQKRTISGRDSLTTRKTENLTMKKRPHWENDGSRGHFDLKGKGRMRNERETYGENTGLGCQQISWAEGLN